ncbi:MAG: hypothetical protein AVDCRST_MAG11-341, partial [uncultured Gemmatimonadaceae bacterium]
GSRRVRGVARARPAGEDDRRAAPRRPGGAHRAPRGPRRRARRRRVPDVRAGRDGAPGAPPPAAGLHGVGVPV